MRFGEIANLMLMIMKEKNEACMKVMIFIRILAIIMVHGYIHKFNRQCRLITLT